MFQADSHCDTITESAVQNKKMRKNDMHIDWSRLHQKAPYLQFMAIFLYPPYYEKILLSDYISVINRLNNEMNENQDICMKIDAKPAIDLAQSEKKVGCLYSIEGLDTINQDIDNIDILYALGVRAVGLTWNHNNELACGINCKEDFGLTELGRSAVARMNSLGIIIDISHASIKTFYDVHQYSTKPFIASHSNAQTLCTHPRNLNNDQLNVIRTREGYVGVNAYPDFLNDTGIASIKDIVRHIEYLCQHIGEDKVGLGFDFDGVTELPKGLTGTQDVYQVAEELAKLNYKERWIQGIMGENLVSFVKKIII